MFICLSAAITVGYIQTAVNVSEGVQVIQLTVAISTPPDEIPIATFFLRVNTSNRTATGLPHCWFGYMLLQIFATNYLR